MKKILPAALALAMTLSLVPAAFAAGGTAYAFTQAVEVDGEKVEFQMYALKDASGNGTNYVKLRDVGVALGFKVDWTRERGVIVETGGSTQPTAPSQPESKAFTLENMQGI